MEMNELKKFWQEDKQETIDTKKLKSMIQSKAQDTISTIRRNLKAEMKTNLLIFPIALAAYLLVDIPAVVYTFYALAGIVVVYDLLLYLQYKTLDQAEATEAGIKTALQMKLDSMQRFIRIYVNGNTALSFLLFLPAAIMGVYVTTLLLHEPFSLEILKSYKVLLPLLILNLLVGFVAYKAIKAVTKKLYGKYTDTLKEHLKELN